MSVLYLTEQRSIVRKTSDRLIVEKDDQVLLEIPCLKLETILIFGNVQVTTQALIEMLDHGIELALFSLSGKLRGHLTPPKGKNIPLRMKQYELAQTETACLELARRLVSAKIDNSVAVLRRFRRNHPEALSPEEIEKVHRAASDISQMTSLDSLRGKEGDAAARYFPLLGALLPAGFQFDTRTRRPPKAPFNALLSFGYVLVGNELHSLLDGMGFDPYLGFFHQIDYGRPSLALDLLEEFRAPLVDSFSLNLLNLRTLDRDDFRSTPEGGVLLSREAMKLYFSAYEKQLTTLLSVDGEQLTFRQLFRRQAERLARALTTGEPYEPFRLPC